VQTVTAYPVPLNTSATPGRTLAAVSQALRDAEAMWFTAGEDEQIAGVYGGRVLASPKGLRLVRYSATSGVEVTGTLRVIGGGLPLRFDGAVTVGGSTAATGVLGLANGKLAGTLDGRIVSGGA
jgi:hypothetical protein